MDIDGSEPASPSDMIISDTEMDMAILADTEKNSGTRIRAGADEGADAEINTRAGLGADAGADADADAGAGPDAGPGPGAEIDMDADAEMGSDANTGVIRIPAEMGLIWTGNRRIASMMEHTEHPSWPHVNFLYEGKLSLHQMAEQFLFNRKFY